MGKYEGIPKREDLAKEDTWAVEDLFSSDEAFEEAFDAIREEYPEAVLKFESRLGENAETLLSYFRTSENCEKKILRLIGYAHLRADENTADNAASERRGRLSAWLAQSEAKTSFVTPELLAIPDAKLEEMLSSSEELAVYRRFFDRLKKKKKHVLSQPEEKLLAGAGEVGEASAEAYTSLIYADMKFPSVRDLEGHIHELTNGTFISLMQNPDRYLRRGAFANLYEEYRSHKNTIAALLNGQMRQLSYFARSRGYKTAREAALSATEIPETVYDNLIDAVHEGLEPMYRYVRLRKKLLKLDDSLHMFDLYVPLVPGSSETIPYEEAQRNVLAMTEIYGEEYHEALAGGFRDRWTDIYENQGKRSGAYSSFTALHPYVLMNYKDDLDSEFTLAHEMGHSMHSWFSNKYQPQVYSDYVIFVAEVASTVNEALLMQHLLKRTENKRERAALLNHFLEQFRATLYRQTMFAEFEREAASITDQGGVLTADVLSNLYYELNKTYYGTDIEVDPEIAMEWARIPHFYYNFYVYQYATGFSAAIALSRRMLNEGEPAVKDYLKFLSGGCSADPISLLKIAGADMSTADPIRSAIRWFSELVDEFAELMDIDPAELS